MALAFTTYREFGGLEETISGQQDPCRIDTAWNNADSLRSTEETWTRKTVFQKASKKG